MKKRLLSVLKFSIFLGLGIFLVWLSVKDFTEQQKQEFIAAIKIADYKWIVLSVVLGILSHISRALRWIMLLEPVGHKPGKVNTFFAVMIGYLTNFVFLRLGEVTRCTVLTKYEKIPFPLAFGTVIAERAFDALCLLLIFLITLFSQFDSIYNLVDEHIFNPVAGIFSRMGDHPTILWGGVIMLVIFALGAIYFRARIKVMLTSKLGKLVVGFWEGLMSIRKMRSPLIFLAHTVFIWTMYYVMLHVCFFSFAETSHLSIGQGMAVMIMGALGIMLTQGGIGAYHLLVSQTLTSSMIMVSVPIAGAFSWIVWSSLRNTR